MGDFILYRNSDIQEKDLDKTVFILQKQGSVNPVIRTYGKYTIHFYPKVYSPIVNFIETENGDFCGSSGTFFYKKQFSDKALKLLLSEFNEGSASTEDFSGTFTIILKKNNRLFLLTDTMGCSRVYKNSQGTVWSSSFLALSSACNTLTPNRQGVYEYIFQEATYGVDTVFNEVSTLNSLYDVEFLDKGEKYLKKQIDFQLAPSTDKYSSIVEENVEVLTDEFKTIVDTFGSNINTALSGGYDSRLILSLLKKQNINPKIYVYGTDASADVRVAQNIARGEGLSLTHIDKSKYPIPDPDKYKSIINNNYLMLDGFPAEGIFDFGANVDTRISRAKTKNILLNGGGGEIYRNFFYLPARPYTGGKFSVQDLIKTFYSRQTEYICQDTFSLHDYRASLQEKIICSLQLDSDKLTRTQLEFSYPAFRLRYWTSKDNTNNTRLGSFSTPFINPKIIRSALKIPLKYKNHGKIQAKIIHAVSPRLAGYVSDYGYSFDQDPTIKSQLKSLLIYGRPVFLRQYSYAIQHMLMKKDVPLSLENHYIKEVIDIDNMIMSDFFILENIKDPMVLARIYTLEYLFNQFI